jgi:hypothetical protein
MRAQALGDGGRVSSDGPIDIGRFDALRARAIAGTTEHIAKLAHIAGPGMGREPRQPRGRKNPTAHVWGEVPEKLASDGCDVATAIAEGRDREHETLESVEQVAPELATRDALLEVRMGCGDDPDVGTLTAARSADATDFIAVEGTQELRLSLERKVADLVEK